MNHFQMYLLEPLTGKPFYPLKLRLQDTLKRMKDILLMMLKRMQMFIAAKDEFFGSVAQNVTSAQKRYTQDYNKRRTRTEIFTLNFKHNTNIFINIHVLCRNLKLDHLF